MIFIRVFGSSPSRHGRDENQRKLEKLCQHVLDAIFSRQSDFPLDVA